MSEWIVYDGEREKGFYDIELKTGEIVRQCYPNAYSWHEMNDTGCRVFKDEEVAKIKRIKMEWD